MYGRDRNNYVLYCIALLEAEAQLNKAVLCQ